MKKEIMIYELGDDNFETNSNEKTNTWNSVLVGKEFEDGSKVTQRHKTHKETTIKLWYRKARKIDCIPIIRNLASFKNKKYNITVSTDHMFKCNISCLPKDMLARHLKYCKNITIPIEAKLHFYGESENLSDGAIEAMKNYVNYGTVIDQNENPDLFDELKNITFEEEIISEESAYIGEDKSGIYVWLTAENINYLVNSGCRVYCNNMLFTNSVYSGIEDVFCVSTNTGNYRLNRLIHHNSVTILNVIYHVLQHVHDINAVLIDPKYTEFTDFKGMKGINAVGNTEREAVEFLRIAKEIVEKRKVEMAKIGIRDIKDYRPSKPTKYVFISGQDIDENQQLDVVIPETGENKKMTAKEILDYVNS